MIRQHLNKFFILGFTFSLLFSALTFAQKGGPSELKIIKGPKASDITLNSASISWETNNSATGFVEFGIDSTFGNKVESTELSIQHQIFLEELEKSTVYFYQVTAIDSTGEDTVFSLIKNFKTLSDEEIASRVEIVTEDANLKIEQTLQFEAVFYNENDEQVDTTIAWSVHPYFLGNIDETGLFTALKQGEGHIVAKVGSAKDSVNIEIELEEDSDEEKLKGGKLVITPDDTTVEIGSSIQFQAFTRDTNGILNEEIVEWSLTGNEIGTITADGLLQAELSGVGLVTAKSEKYEQTTMIIVYDPSLDSSGINTIRISRVFPDGKILPAHIVQEGQVYDIGGLKHPMSILNGGKIYFPYGCLDEDITIHIKLPEMAKVVGDSVVFGKQIVSGITFNVFVNDTLKEPYYFNIPLNVTLPFKRGILEQLKLNPADISMFFADDTSSFEAMGITNVTVDSAVNRIFGQVAHFSTIVLKESENASSAIENDFSSSLRAAQFELLQNYPNPFNPETEISFHLAQPSHVTIKIYNVLGTEIYTLTDKNYTAGLNTVTWNGKDAHGNQVSSGVYFYKLHTDTISLTRKMTLIR